MQTHDRAVLRTISGHCLEWGHYHSSGVYAEDHSKKFAFLRGCFDQVIASGKDIPLTMDLDGKTFFARTGDGSMRLENDDIGLLVTADLLDTPENRALIRAIDHGKVRGWSHRAAPVFFGSRCRKEDGVLYQDHVRCGLAEITLVIRKVPRAKVRTVPLFIEGGPQLSRKASAHV